MVEEETVKESRASNYERKGEEEQEKKQIKELPNGKDLKKMNLIKLQLVKNKREWVDFV